MSNPDKAIYQLNTIYFYLTEGCNLRCRHCWIMTEQEPASPSKPKAFLELRLFESILEQAKPLGLNGVKLTGGEPFLHPKIRSMMEIIREAQLRLIIETNGVLLTPELAALAASCSRPSVSVSLDGTDPETHEWVRQVPGSYEATLRGIGHLVRAGIRPQIIFTIMRKNQNQIEAILRLAQELGAASVKFNILQPSPRSDKIREEGEALSLMEVLKIGHWVERELAAEFDFPIFFSHPPAFRPLKRIISKNGKLTNCGIRNIIGVLANGHFALCGIGSHIPELVLWKRLPRQAGGRVAEQPGSPRDPGGSPTAAWRYLP